MKIKRKEKLIINIKKKYVKKLAKKNQKSDKY